MKILQYIKKWITVLTDTVAACMGSVIPVLVAGGFLKMIVAIAGMIAPGPAESSTLQLISCLSDAPFYFLPVLVAYAASQYFQVSTMGCLMTVLALVLPSFTESMGAEQALTLFGLPVYQTNYAYAVIQIILLVYVMSWVEKLLEKLLPGLMRNLFQTMLLAAVGYILGVLFICPAASYLSEHLFALIANLQTSAPVIAWFLVNLLWPVLIITGMHWIFITMAITSLAVSGVENGIMMVCFASAMTLSAAALTAYLKSSDPKLKMTAFTSGVTNLLSGAAEPCLYGVCLPNRALLIACMIGGSAAGIYQGIVGISGYIYSFPSILCVFMFSSQVDTQNFAQAMIGAAIAFAAALVAAMCLYRPSHSKN